MLRKFKIGNGDHGCFATNIVEINNNNLSENEVSYWIYPTVFDYELKIMKNTKEGKQLYEKINNRENIDIINNFIDGLVLDLLTISDIKQAIQETYDKGVLDGTLMAQLKMRNAIGL